MVDFAICGAMKTGSTLLANLLDRQPGIGVMWESSWYDATADGSILLAGPNAERNGITHTPATQVTNAFDRQRWVKASAAIHAFRGARQCDVVGDKHWSYLANWHIATSMRPVLAVYNVRHPCGVWWSGQTFLNRGAGDAVLTSLLETDALFQRHSPPQVITRYEDYLIHPTREIARVLSALKGRRVPAAAVVLERTEPDPLPERWYWIRNSTEPPNADHGERWRDEMTDEQRRRVMEWPGVAAFCERYGYE